MFFTGTYLVQSEKRGWQRHKAPHEFSLQTDNSLRVINKESGKIKENIDLRGGVILQVQATFVATGRKSSVKIALVGQPVRKVAFILESDLDTVQLCRGLQHHGIEVRGLEAVSDGLAFHSSDQLVAQSLEADAPDLSRPEVQAFIMRFVGDLGELFAHVFPAIPTYAVERHGISARSTSSPVGAQEHSADGDPLSWNGRSRQTNARGKDVGLGRDTNRGRSNSSIGARDRGDKGDGERVAGLASEDTRPRGEPLQSEGATNRHTEGKSWGRDMNKWAGSTSVRDAGGFYDDGGDGGGGDQEEWTMLGNPPCCMNGRTTLSAPTERIAAQGSTQGYQHRSEATGSREGNQRKGREAHGGGRRARTGRAGRPDRPDKAEGEGKRRRGGWIGEDQAALEEAPRGTGDEGVFRKNREQKKQSRKQPRVHGTSAGTRKGRENERGAILSTIKGGGRDREAQNNNIRSEGDAQGQGHGQAQRKKQSQSQGREHGHSQGAHQGQDRGAGSPSRPHSDRKKKKEVGIAAQGVREEQGKSALGLSGASNDPPEAPTTASGRAVGLSSALMNIWSMVYKHPCAWAFRERVDTKDVPDYLNVIKNPIDLQSIRERLDKDTHYTSKGMLHDDLRLMCENAKLYNGPGTVYHSEASKLLEFINELI